MGLFQDFRFGLRILARSPGFALVAIVTLGLGIGANSTVFTLVNGVFFRGLPYENPREIVSVRSLQQPQGFGGRISWPDYQDLRAEARSFRDLGAYSTASVDLSDEDSFSERVQAAMITVNTFGLLGQSPALGRGFTPDDAGPDAPPVVLIGHGLWRSRYGGDPATVGRTVRVVFGNETVARYRTIVGVMPEGEGFPNGAGMWIPFTPGEEDPQRDRRSLQVFGRLGDGMTLEAANTETETIATSLAAAWPETNENVGTAVFPFTDLGGDREIRAVFTGLQGAVTFVLLIACANVANLLLSRAVGRMRETSVRTAVGAGRWRIVRQLLVESLTMSILAGVLGLGLTVFGVRTFWNAVADTGPPYWLSFPIDYQVFAYFLAVSVASGILFGLAPALQVSKTNVNENLREGGRGSTGSIRARRLTGALLIGEIAMTLVLLVGAGLMIRSLLNTQRTDLGFDPANLLTARLTLRPSTYPEPADRVAFADRLLERLSGIPGLEGVAVASFAPAGGAAGRPLRLEDREPEENVPETGPQTWSVAVVPGYFEALGFDLRAGRAFDPTDGQPGAEVAIVNEPFAERYWPGESPLGRRIRISNAEDAAWLEIVGVGPAVLQSSSDQDPSVQPTVYVPFRQEPGASAQIVARSGLPAAVVAQTIREEVRRLDPELPLYDIRGVEEMLRLRNWPYRVFGSLFAIFALIALVMSSVGIYGVTAYAVGQRTQEIGIRMALGARNRDILLLVLRQGMIRIAIGLAIGLFFAWAVSRILESVLVGVTPTDPLTFVLIPLILTAVTLAACLIPARRALGLDPADALRTE